MMREILSWFLLIMGLSLAFMAWALFSLFLLMGGCSVADWIIRFMKNRDLDQALVDEAEELQLDRCILNFMEPCQKESCPWGQWWPDCPEFKVLSEDEVRRLDDVQVRGA